MTRIDWENKRIEIVEYVDVSAVDDVISEEWIEEEITEDEKWHILLGAIDDDGYKYGHMTLEKSILRQLEYMLEDREETAE